MSDKSAIEWTDATWNPVTGCDEVSPGCAHCYAKTFAERWRGIKGHHFENGFDLQLRHSRLDQPLKWSRPRRIFVNSMSDLFHEDVPDSFIDLVFAVMAAASHHTFQVLTKRPERMRRYLLERDDARLWQSLKSPWPGEEDARREQLRARLAAHPMHQSTSAAAVAEPLPNVWLGVSIENRRFVSRADVLRETPAAVRFISAEPLLGPLVPLDSSSHRPPWRQKRYPRIWGDGYEGPMLDLDQIDWLIVGGESGPGHRPINPEWVRDLRDLSQQRRPSSATGGTAFFFKQWGGNRPSAGGRELDGRTWDEVPTHLMPEQFNRKDAR